MDIVGSAILVVLSFLLGIVASAYGAKIGKAIEKRNELLEGLADWIDELMEAASIINGKNVLLSPEEINKITIKMSIKPARWIGIMKSFDNSELSKNMTEFSDITKSIAISYENTDKTSVSNGYKDLTQKAISLHQSIASMMISDLPSWLFRKA
jgi:hypothetical protein